MGTSHITTEDVVIKYDQKSAFLALGKVFWGALIFTFQIVHYCCVLKIQKTSLRNESHLEELLSSTELYHYQSLKTYLCLDFIKG